MIELTYFPEVSIGKPVYQVIQFNPGEPWQVVDGDEVIATAEKLHGLWNLHYWAEIPDGLATGIGKLIDEQYFNKLPADLKLHWEEYVHEVICQSDAEYIVICKEETDLERFEKIFRGFINELIKDEWKIRFRVYNSNLTADFEVIVNY